MNWITEDKEYFNFLTNHSPKRDGAIIKQLCADLLGLQTLIIIIGGFVFLFLPNTFWYGIELIILYAFLFYRTVRDTINCQVEVVTIVSEIKRHPITKSWGTCVARLDNGQDIKIAMTKYYRIKIKEEDYKQVMILHTPKSEYSTVIAINNSASS